MDTSPQHYFVYSSTVVLYYVGRPLPFGEKQPPQNQQQEIFSFFLSFFLSLPPNFLGRLQPISYSRTDKIRTCAHTTENTYDLFFPPLPKKGGSEGWLLRQFVWGEGECSELGATEFFYFFGKQKKSCFIVVLHAS